MSLPFEKNQTDASPWLSPPGFNMELFRPVAKVLNCKKNVVLYNKGEPGDYVYVIISGRVEHYVSSSDGLKKIIGISVPGCLVGEMPLFDEKAHFCSAQICAHSSLYQIPYRTFRSLMKQSPDLMQQVMRSLALKVRSLQTQIELTEFHDAPSRVARILLFILDDYGVTHRDEIFISLTFTHSDIAFMTGLSRVSVSNAFSRMISDGVLRKEGSRYYVKDRARLEDLCGDV